MNSYPDSFHYGKVLSTNTAEPCLYLISGEDSSSGIVDKYSEDADIQDANGAVSTVILTTGPTWLIRVFPLILLQL